MSGTAEKKEPEKNTKTPGSDVTLRIRGYGSDGEGVASLPDGMTCFVRGALDGELCSVHLDKIGRSCAWGTAGEILEPSNARVVPDCPCFGQCGGCALRHMSYPEELRFKRRKVQDALAHIGGLDLPVPEVCGAENILRYRNKVQFPVAPGPCVGFYQRRSHRVIDTEDCLLHSGQVACIRRAVKAWMQKYEVPAYQEETGRGLVRHIFVRTNAAGESLCCLFVNGEELPREAELVEYLRGADPGMKGVVLGVNKRKGNGILGESYRTLWGRDTLDEKLCGLTFRLSVPSFFQVNLAQTQVLYDKILDLAGLKGNETVLDLYCGIGTISLAMAARAGSVIGVETVSSAVDDAQANAERNNILNAEFTCEDAKETAARLAAGGLQPDLIVADPPRRGLALEVIRAILQMSPGRIIYVSCNPATLARDLAIFGQDGYRTWIDSAVDLFPRTSHVETVAQISKKS